MRTLLCLSTATLLALPLAARADLTERQLKLLTVNCVQCHARTDIGAPLMGNRDDWAKRVRMGEAAMLRNVIQGMNGMPPLGYCAACDEADLRALTRWVAGIEGGQ